MMSRFEEIKTTISSDVIFNENATISNIDNSNSDLVPSNDRNVEVLSLGPRKTTIIEVEANYQYDVLQNNQVGNKHNSGNVLKVDDTDQVSQYDVFQQ